MDYQPAISVALEDRNGPLVVIDLALALSPLGLLTTMRLAGEVLVVLPPCLWRRLDGWSVERLHPGLAKRVCERSTADDAAQADLANVMAQWECARLELFSRRVYWLAESVDEAVLPKDVDPQVIARFDLRLARSRHIGAPRCRGIDRGWRAQFSGALGSARTARLGHRDLVRG